MNVMRERERERERDHLKSVFLGFSATRDFFSFTVWSVTWEDPSPFDSFLFGKSLLV